MSSEYAVCPSCGVTTDATKEDLMKPHDRWCCGQCGTVLNPEPPKKAKSVTHTLDEYAEGKNQL